MSSTPVDIAKITQMLDAGWVCQIERGGMGGYVARARHENTEIWELSRERYRNSAHAANPQDVAHSLRQQAIDEIVDLDWSDEGQVDTEDFTPEQAMTRLAYKVHGEFVLGEGGGA